ncbi:MAG: penicillin-binding protein 1C [Bacteroidales bacterium]|nr:penicillin-binding protein 1C [Bacteroidales bacterium]MDD4671167.1 penicillin-binding protein 1C [Bacteroidales bacterium]
MTSETKYTRITAIISVTVSLLLIGMYIFCLPQHLFDNPVSAVLQSSDGHLMGARIAGDGQYRFPQSSHVPDKFAKSIITYEDKRFRSHPGVDLLAIARAVSLNYRAGEVKSGASTITMQTIRLSREGKNRTYFEKIVEAILATRLEMRCSKDEILALYASNAPFGGNVVGLEAASWRYFGRYPDELSWAESAMLAVLPNAPSLIHLGKNRELLLKKRNFLLDRLSDAGIIDSLECALAKDEELPQKPFPMPDIAYHYLETLRKQSGDKLYRSDIDYSLQQRVEDIAAKNGEIFGTNNVDNLAAIVLEVKSGNILAYCGNINHDKNGSKGNDVDVVQAPRSSGSTLKPFLYAAMLDEGTLLPTMLVPDIPFYYKNFSPSNFNNTFDGAVPAYSVIQRSLNIPSVRMLNEYGIEKFTFLLQKLGFTTITRGADTYGLSLILGGAEIKLIDLAQAYRNISAQLVSFSEEPSENKLFRPHHPLSSAAIWSTFEVLSDVNRPEEENNWKSFSSSRKVAWKTGTSYGNRDAWSVGATPEYVVAVWVGNCDGEGRPHLTGIGYAAPVMFEIFNLLPRTSWFETPENELEEIAVCHLSGYPVSDNCTFSQGEIMEVVDTILVPAAPQRPQVCPFHKIIHLSEDLKYIVNSDCYSVSKMKTVSWFVLPPAQEWYYMKTHSDYRQLPPLHPDYMGYTEKNTGSMFGTSGNSRGNSSPVIEIIYPQNGMKVASPVALDSKSRGVIFSAAHQNPSATIFWHIDNQYIGSTSNKEHKIHVIPTQGPHILTIVDQNGNSAKVSFVGE